MPSIRTRYCKPFVVMAAVIVGVVGIMGFHVYADRHIDAFARLNQEGMQLLNSWEELELATHEILYTTHPDRSRSAVSTSFANFDDAFEAFQISPFILKLRAHDTLFARDIATADSSWRTARPRLLTIQRRLREIHDESPSGRGRQRDRILIDLGYRMEHTDSALQYAELAGLVDDIDYIVNIFDTHFTAMLSRAMGRLSQDVEAKSRHIRLFAILISVVVGASVVVFLLGAYRVLKESNNRYLSLQANIPIGLFRSRLDGTILHVNEAMADIFGFPSPPAIIGLNIGELGAQSHSHTEFVSRLMADGEVTNHELEMKRRDGSSIWISCSARRLDEAHGKGAVFAGMMEDITNRKLAEHRLSEATRELEQVLETSPAVIYRCGPGPDFPTTFISQNIQAQVGVAPQTFYDDPMYWTNRIHPDDVECFLNGIDLVSEGRSATIEYRLLNGTGEVIWAIDEMRPLLDDTGRVCGLVGSWLDITDRKITEEALRKSEELNAAIIEKSPIGIAVRGRNGRLLHNNAAWADIWGLSEENIRKQMTQPDDVSTLDDYYCDLPEWCDKIKAIYRDGGQLLVPVLERSRRDEQRRWLSQVFYALKNNADEVERVVILTDDITERVQAQQALQESEKRFRTAFEMSPDAFAITRLEDGICCDVNRGFVDLSGYSRDECIGATTLSLGLWANPGERRMMVDLLKEHGHIDNFEAVIRRKNGDLCTVLISACVVSLGGQPNILAIARDIEERKRVEMALRESEERFRAVFESAEDAIFIKNGRLEYTAINASMANMMGLPAREIIGLRRQDIFKENEGTAGDAPDIRVLHGEIANEHNIRSIQGNLHSFHVIKVPMRDGDGNIVGLCGIARDITETENLREQASRAQRLETAGRIAGQVAHDFNNLLGPLVAYPGLIRDELPIDHPALEYIDDMERAAEQIAQINQQLLTLGRRGHYTQEPLDLNILVRQTNDQIAHHVHEIEIVTQLADDLMSVVGGAAQLIRVISNLMHNALDAMPPAGRLLVKTENRYIDSTNDGPSSLPSGEYVLLTVADTGCGISPDILPKIFDPFFTTKTAGKKRGSGLGLSVVHAVIEDHGGFIDVASRPGQGTTISVYLPITRETIEEETTDNIAGGAETILIVDDDRLQRDVHRRLMEKLGYTAHTVESGEAALAFLRETPCDILLLDMLMPNGWDGTETLRRVLEIYPDQKAIIVSGYSESTRVTEALQMGAHAYVRKPLTLRAVATAVREALDASKPAATLA